MDGSPGTALRNRGTGRLYCIWSSDRSRSAPLELASSILAIGIVRDVSTTDLVFAGDVGIGQGAALTSCSRGLFTDLWT